MDFSTPPVPPIEFTIDGDIFYAAGEVPGGTVTDLAVAGATDEENGADALQAAMAFFDQVLLPESAELFAQRFRNPERPITLPKAMKIFAWLMERYTDFPTQELLPSPPGSTATAKSSVARSSSKVASTRSATAQPSVPA
jgi:hypothetical protein